MKSLWTSHRLFAGLGITGAVAVAVTLLVGDWIAGASVLLLAAIWAFVRAPEGPPVPALALTHQWLQVCVGVHYEAFTGRTLNWVSECDYRTMMLIGMGCVLALLVGLHVGMQLTRGMLPPLGRRAFFSFGQEQLLLFYILTIPLGNVLGMVSENLPQVQQLIYTLSYLHLGCYYLLCRRLIRPTFRWNLMLLLLGCEVILNLATFHATFREPLIIFILVLLEDLNFRTWTTPRWVVTGVAIVTIVVLGWMWTGFKGEFRSRLRHDADVQSSMTARYALMLDLMQDWIDSDWDRKMADLDRLVDRTWAIYYPALAVERVPGKVPYTNGEMMLDAVVHVLVPRLINPDKPALASESHKVRRYSGVWVAAEESETNIAFGYAAESYVDFGLPVMFLPILIFGFLMGMVYEWLFHVIWHRDLAIVLSGVVFWLSMYSFERSWAKTLGQAGLALIVLGGVTFALDRWMLNERLSRPRLG